MNSRDARIAAIDCIDNAIEDFLQSDNIWGNAPKSIAPWYRGDWVLEVERAITSVLSELLDEQKRLMEERDAPVFGIGDIVEVIAPDNALRGDRGTVSAYGLGSDLLRTYQITFQEVYGLDPSVNWVTFHAHELKLIQKAVPNAD